MLCDIQEVIHKCAKCVSCVHVAPYLCGYDFAQDKCKIYLFIDSEIFADRRRYLWIAFCGLQIRVQYILAYKVSRSRDKDT